MSIYQFLGNFTIAPSAVRVLDIDLNDMRDLQLFLKREYEATASTTDVKLVIKDGNGPYQDHANELTTSLCKLDGFSAPDYETTGEDRSSELTDATTSSGSPVSVTDKIDVIVDECSRFIRIELTNLDDTNTVTITLTADI